MAYYAPFYQQPVNYLPNQQNGYNVALQPSYAYSNVQGTVTQQNVAQSQQSDGMIWVLGKNEAESYPVAPNCQVVLWDKNTPTLYVKSMSANNVPNLRVLDFTERSVTAENAPNSSKEQDLSKYATKDELTALRGDYEALAGKINKIEQVFTEKPTKKSKGGDD